MTTAKKTAAADAKDTLETAAKAGRDAYVRNFDQSFAFAQEQVEKVATSFLKGFDEAHGQGRANLDALIKANAIAAKGFEEIGRAWFGFAQTSLDHSAAAAKAVLGAKSLREAVDVQSGYAKTAIDNLLAEGTRLSELGVKVTNEALAPLGERVQATVETLAKPRAA